MSDSEDGVVEQTIAEDIVVTKYKMAGEIVNRTLKTLVGLSQPGKSVREICVEGDRLLFEETAKVYKKEKDLKKGIAFPTCLSVNNCIFHFSPSKNDTDYVLKDGDVVKIELGAQIDGFAAVAAHTVVVQTDATAKVTGRKADAILAAYWASQAAIRLLKPENTNVQITEAVQKITDDYKCKPIEGMLSHQLKQFQTEAEKTIIQNPNDAQRKEHEKCTFKVHEVYAIDVSVSTGEGIAKPKDVRTSVFKKTDFNYQLKLKSSRALLSEIKTKYGNFPFNLRNFEEEAKARMGIVECVSHKMVDSYDVLYEKPTEIVARFKFTVLIMPNGVNLVTGLPVELDKIESEHSVLDAALKVKQHKLFITITSRSNLHYLVVTGTGYHRAPEQSIQEQGQEEELRIHRVHTQTMEIYTPKF